MSAFPSTAAFEMETRDEGYGRISLGLYLFLSDCSKGRQCGLCIFAVGVMVLDCRGLFFLHSGPMTAFTPTAAFEMGTSDE